MEDGGGAGETTKKLTKKALVIVIDSKVKKLNKVDKKIEVEILSAHASLTKEETKRAVKNSRGL